MYDVLFQSLRTIGDLVLEILNFLKTGYVMTKSTSQHQTKHKVCHDVKKFVMTSQNGS